MMKSLKISFGILLLALLISGCATQKASETFDMKAKTLKPPSDKAVLFVVRPSFFGFAVRFSVDCNDKYLGSTNGKLYIYATLDPGKYLLVSESENKAKLEITVDAGKAYYVKQMPRLGFMMARNKLKLLNETDGKNALLNCKLSADCMELSKPAN